MKQARFSLPEVMVLAGTRVALGAGLALLLADSLPPRKRKMVGWGMFLVGAATTVPLMGTVLRRLDGDPMAVEKKPEV